MAVRLQRGEQRAQRAQATGEWGIGEEERPGLPLWGTGAKGSFWASFGVEVQP